MLRRISRQLQPKVGLHRCADIRRAGGIDVPSAVLVLMPQNPVRRLLKAFLVPRPEQSVQQNVVRLQRGIRLELPAPVALFMLLREKIFSRGRNRRAHTRAQSLNFAKAKLWVRT